VHPFAEPEPEVPARGRRNPLLTLAHQAQESLTIKKFVSGFDRISG
jgi:hypothetical protein